MGVPVEGAELPGTSTLRRAAARPVRSTPDRRGLRDPMGDAW